MFACSLLCHVSFWGHVAKFAGGIAEVMPNPGKYPSLMILASARAWSV